jgi:hypothetical protein
MKNKPLPFLLIGLIISGCTPKVVQRPALNTDVYLNGVYTTPNANIQIDTITLRDRSGNR